MNRGYTARHRTRVLATLCAELNATATTFPGTFTSGPVTVPSIVPYHLKTIVGDVLGDGSDKVLG